MIDVLPAVKWFTITKAPHSVFGLGTWFGRNPPTLEHPEGTDDRGDMDSSGHDLKGAFGDDTHAPGLIGLSIPIPIFHATIGHTEEVYADVRRRRYLFDVCCFVTGRHAAGVPLVDLGPNAALNRPLDMTFGLATLLGCTTNAVCAWWVTDTQTGLILPVKGWDFAAGKIA
jgi:hypothetical protein